MLKMYRVGDLIVYGSTGVCRVTEIVTKELKIKDEKIKQLFYVLKPLYQKCTISIPIDSTKVFMRPIISKDEAERLIDTIPEIQVEAYHNRVLNQLAVHYDSLLNTHNCTDLIELTKSIYTKRELAEQQGKKLGAVDEKYMKRSEELLFGELAAALDIPIEKVPEYIAEKVEEKLGENLPSRREDIS